MEGLEALVQAATQERQRLGGEKVEEPTESIAMSTWSNALVSSAPESSLSNDPLSSNSARYDGASKSSSPSATRAISSSPSRLYRSPNIVQHSPRHWPHPPSTERETSPFQQTQTSSTMTDDAATQPPPKRRRSSSQRSTESCLEGTKSKVEIAASAAVDAMEAQPEDQIEVERKDTPPEHASLQPSESDDALKSPPRSHIARLRSGSPFSGDPGSRSMPSTESDSVLLKSEDLDSPVIPLDTLGATTHEAKRKANKGKLDDTVVAKSKEKVKPKSKAKQQAQPQTTTTKDETDDWFLEQFKEVESTKTSFVSNSSPTMHRARTPPAREVHHRKKAPSPPHEEYRHASSSKKPLTRLSRSPTPLEMLEAELDDVPLAPTSSHSPPVQSTLAPHSSPAVKTVATEADLDLDTELERTLQDEPRVSPLPPKPKPKPRPRAKPKPQPEKVDMDVEDELLALLDDDDDTRKGKNVWDTSERTSSKNSGKSGGHGPSAMASSGPDASPLMPPPGGRSVSQLHEISACDKGKEGHELSASEPNATPDTPAATSISAPTPVPGGATKGKDASKKKVQAKSRAKVTATSKTKSKPSLGKERSATPVASPHPTPNPSDVPPPAGKGKKTQASLTAKRAVSAAGGTSRSRSTSVMPGDGEAATSKKRAAHQAQDDKEEKEEDEQEVDDRLYCVCRTPYDEDRVMIACDRCDEWYHTQCVNMPDLEVDLVDQFICPICVANNPHLPLRTTYKKRCLAGLAHPRPGSQHACHKPARGAFSKYCSDECGVRFMRERIERFVRDNVKNVAKSNKEAKESENMRGLWESVKSAGQREAVVLRVLDSVDERGEPLTEIVTPRVSKHARLIARLEVQLAKISNRRDELKADDEIVAWREAVLGYAAHRAERHGDCGWDARLLWSSDEVREYGAEVVDAYERLEMQGGDDNMAVDSQDQMDDRGWWCTGKRKCDRHAGWQKLRQAEIDLEKELYEAELERLTTREREIRKRIEDIQAAHPDAGSDSRRQESISESHAACSEARHLVNGTTTNATINGDVDELPKVNGVNGVEGAEKKGKKRKVDAR